MDVIDLGIGAPDLLTPTFVIKAMKHELEDPKNSTYSPYHGLQEYREAVATFYLKE
ncbi:aminotransferase class I/II-fold pyridoxal phosphate-dependent enzyme [Bacillus sp. FJAT-52991]|uniref:Aminotransferase class I/II-fold pyridoxal phosphate-dependent enzyme n=1 Tax=Bacillus kandeliae TaxID=3129297 RepID=A0ABZ2NB49_9BACI